jgi:hypothetical protein
MCSAPEPVNPVEGWGFFASEYSSEEANMVQKAVNKVKDEVQYQGKPTRGVTEPW